MTIYSYYKLRYAVHFSDDCCLIAVVHLYHNINYDSVQNRSNITTDFLACTTRVGRTASLQIETRILRQNDISLIYSNTLKVRKQHHRSTLIEKCSETELQLSNCPLCIHLCEGNVAVFITTKNRFKKRLQHASKNAWMKSVIQRQHCFQLIMWRIHNWPIESLRDKPSV